MKRNVLYQTNVGESMLDDGGQEESGIGFHYVEKEGNLIAFIRRIGIIPVCCSIPEGQALEWKEHHTRETLPSGLHLPTPRLITYLDSRREGYTPICGQAEAIAGLYEAIAQRHRDLGFMGESVFNIPIFEDGASQEEQSAVEAMRLNLEREFTPSRATAGYI